VRAWKERGLRHAANLAAELVVERVPAPDVDAVTFIPRDEGRYLERGHHPAERLARCLSASWGIECGPLLARRRAVERQAGLSLVDRRRNVRGAFQARGRIPSRVALIDDVYTTGSTCAAAATALRAGGAQRIEVITFARAVR
jgi:predicted amidophosphoribosyltransferase